MKGIIILGLVLLTGPTYADEALLKKHMCTACHNVDKKIVGPAYKDVAKKYQGQKDAVVYLSGKIRNGGKGVWGPIPMMPNAKVTEQEAKQLAEYILKLK
jgi:cytochrome c